MNKRLPPIGIGVITVLTVLLVLTLSVFSALTLTSARADLALSKRNAETVSAYYTADAEASRQYAEFAAGIEPELETIIPMTEYQSLRLHLVREGDSVKILAWQTVVNETEGGQEETDLPVWDGQVPGQS